MVIDKQYGQELSNDCRPPGPAFAEAGHIFFSINRAMFGVVVYCTDDQYFACSEILAVLFASLLLPNVIDCVLCDSCSEFY